MRARFCNILLLGCLVVIVGYQSVSGQNFDEQKLTTYMNTLADEQKMMGSVAIDSAGEEVYYHSVGFMDPERNQKAGPDTKYRIGSVTKTFTATIIMQLIEEEKLSLSTRLPEFYPDIPQAQKITIEHLLRHQSGLFNFTNAPDYTDWMTKNRSKEQLLEIFYEDEPQFSPGEQTSYSNTNYVLLGYIIEDITGEPYAEQLQQRITNPLGLQHTFYGDEIEPHNNEAFSFQYNQSAWQEAPETDMSIPGGAGAIVSTPSEMNKFIRALFTGDLVSEKSLEAMTKTEQRLGLGLMKIPFYDSFAYGHNGGIDGFQSNLAYFPQKEVALAVTANGLNYQFNDILIGVWSIYFGRDFEIPSFEEQDPITLSTSQMQKYVGNYRSDQLGMDIKVFIDDKTLKAQATGQQAFPLTANNQTTMRFDPAGVVMEFDSLANDKYQKFTLKQAGGSYLFSRENNSDK